MSNAINTVKSNALKIAKMAAAYMQDETQFFKSVDKFDVSEFKGNEGGFKPGNTVSVSVPAHAPIKSDGFDYSGGWPDIKETNVLAKLDITKSTALNLTSLELAHDADLGKVFQRFVKPYLADLTASFDGELIKRACIATPNIVGTPGSSVFDQDLILAAREKKRKYLAPIGVRENFFLGDSTTMRSAVGARKGLFNDQEEVSKAFRNGAIGRADGHTWLENELIYRHTNGGDVAFAVEADVVPIVTGMTTLGVDGVSSGQTIKAGTKFTIAGVNAVHPQTKTDLGFLQQFTVTEDVTEVSGNTVTLKIYPAIYSSASGSLQNVSALPVDETACTVLTGAASTTYSQGIAYHKQAFRVGTVKLELPKNAEFAVQASEGGMNVRIVRDWDQTKATFSTRLDLLGLFVPVRPEWACVLTA